MDLGPRVVDTASPLNALEKRMYLRWREQAVGRKVLIAVSGGLDSICLAELLRTLQTRLQIHLVVATVHHGEMQGANSLQNMFRNDAVEKVHSWARENGLEFITHPDRPVWSDEVGEKELRDFRYQALRALAMEHGCDWIALAHHKDDQLETRLIQLIRGCGLQGLVGMSELNGDLWRPLLSESRKSLLKYANEKNLKWLEDPSNTRVEPFRNWLRQHWLVELENKRPGSVETLMQSLQNLVDESVGKKPQLEDFLTPRGGLRRQEFLSLTEGEKRGLLARYFIAMGYRNFGKSHIDELIKRLDSPRNDLSFNLLKRKWTITPTEILAEG